MATAVESEPLTRAELAEAMTNHVATLRRMPEHWVERRAAIRARIDALLEDYLSAPA